MIQSHFSKKSSLLNSSFVWSLILILITVSIFMLMGRFIGIYEQEVSLRLPEAQPGEVRLGAVTALVLSAVLNSVILVFLTVMAGLLASRLNIRLGGVESARTNRRAISVLIGIYVALRTLGWYLASIFGVAIPIVMKSFFEPDISMLLVYFGGVLLLIHEGGSKKSIFVVPLVPTIIFVIAFLVL